jgi:hypothetical protein
VVVVENSNTTTDKAFRNALKWRFVPYSIKKIQNKELVKQKSGKEGREGEEGYSQVMVYASSNQ